MAGRWYDIAVVGITLLACATTPSGSDVAVPAPATSVRSNTPARAVTASRQGHIGPTPPQAKLLLGWGSALLEDGRMVLPNGITVDPNAAARDATLLQRGFLWGRLNGALLLLRAGATSPQVPHFFQTLSIAQVSRSGACVLTDSGEIWCHGFAE